MTNAPQWTDKDQAMLNLNSLVALLGGDNGPSIQLRAYIAGAGNGAEPDAAFDAWYAAQRHQLSNEQVCRLIWRRSWAACLSIVTEAGRAAATGTQGDA